MLLWGVKMTVQAVSPVEIMSVYEGKNAFTMFYYSYAN